MNNAKIEQKFKEIFTDCKVDRIVFIGGMTNKNYLVVCDNDKFVFRLPRKNANSIINRINEKNNQILSFKSGFNVQTVYFNEKSGIKITKFLEEAKTLNPQTVREHIEEIGKDIKNIHSSNMPFANHFDAFKEMDKYLSLLSSEYKNHKFLKDGLILFEKLKNKLIEINMDLYNKSFIYTPTHGDIVPENILAIKNPDNSIKKLYFIDWEYSGLNDPIWDVAFISVESNFNKQEDEKLIKSYGLKNDEVIKIDIFKSIQDTLWSVWGLAKMSAGEDLTSYVDNRFKQAFDRKIF